MTTTEGNHPPSREELVERWRNYPASVLSYQGGMSTDGFTYPAGTRLMIDGEQVMDTCETPWCIATIDAVFEGKRRTDPPLAVLDRGFGLGITANLILQKLIGLGGGDYHIIELNRDMASAARRWRESQMRRVSNMAGNLPGTRPAINITVHEGDAYAKTREFYYGGQKFDVIVSDTYPLDEDERGVNDLLDLGNLKRCLSPDGHFTFSAHFPGSTGGVVPPQRDMLIEHFKDYAVSEVLVLAPPDYEFLKSEHGPVGKLPVVVCKNPKL